MFDVLQAQENPDQFFPLAACLAAFETRGGANAARGEKPRLGLSSLTTASNLGFAVCNSTTALGLRTGWAENRGGAYRWARYYNSLTGRFLSRDPEAGRPADPKTLHKYLYAGGDPVNRIDPTGRDDYDEYGLIVSKTDMTISIARFAKMVLTSEQCITIALGWIFDHPEGDPGTAWLVYLYCMSGF